VFAALALASILALPGCATMDISTDWDPAVDFTTLRTYAWGKSAEPDDPRGNDSLIEGRVRTAVDRELAARGYALEQGGSVDFVVSYFAAVESKLDVRVLNDYYGYRPGWGSYDYGAGSRTYVREYDQGTLVLDIANPDTSKLYWRGTAQTEVTDAATPAESEAIINEAVTKMLERFPPDVSG
jgi:hypothetical protein